jgi:hypothetical protein
MLPASEPISPATILSRIHFPNTADLSPAEARFILQIGFTEQDRTRIRELLAKNREGSITTSETEELDSFLSVSYFLDILHSKARLALKRDQSGTAA